MEQEHMENINELATAYTKAYAEITNAVKNSKNPHLGNTYADLGSVLATVRPVLAKHNLAVYQSPGKITEVGGIHLVSVTSILMHASGKSLAMETQVPIAPQLDKKSGTARVTAQAAGSAITYARRYALAAICGITQQDDDGNEASTVYVAPDDPALLDSIKSANSEIELAALKEAVRGSGGQVLIDAYLKRKDELRKAK